MKIYCTVFLLFTAFLHAQDNNRTKHLIDSLEILKSQLIMQQNRITLQLDSLKSINYSLSNDSDIYALISDDVFLRDSPSFAGELLVQLKRGTKIQVISYDPETDFLKVNANDSIGYIDYEFVEISDSIRRMIERYKLLKQATLDSLNQIRINQDKQTFIKSVDDFFKKHPKANKKYRKDIIENKISLGMSREMVILSWGLPIEVNRTVSMYGIREQWVYENVYVYFDDGILTTWQD